MAQRAGSPRAAGVKTPIYRFMFCETFAVGFPPRPYALTAHLAPLEEEAGLAPWMIAGVCADLRPLIGETVAAAGPTNCRRFRGIIFEELQRKKNERTRIPYHARTCPADRIPAQPRLPRPRRG
jgi:hypothetical protein